MPLQNKRGWFYLTDLLPFPKSYKKNEMNEFFSQFVSYLMRRPDGRCL
jgi:hypothetical protein